MSKSGADQRGRPPQPRQPRGKTGGASESERAGPRQFFSEVRAELRKVAWPTRDEVVNSSVVVLIAVIFLSALIFGYDFLSAKFVLFLYD